MSSNIPEARERIQTAIDWLKSDNGMPVKSVIRELRRALSLMTRKPRSKTAEPKARRTYMTKAMVDRIVVHAVAHPTHDWRKIARVFKTDPERTKRALETVE